MSNNNRIFARTATGEDIKPRIEVPTRIYLVDGENKTLIDDYLKRIIKEALVETLNGMTINETVESCKKLFL